MPLIKHVKTKLKELQLEENKFLLAVSGGKDSMVLLDVFLKLNLPFEVAHMNYNLREDDSVADEELVVDYCNANSVLCHVNRPVIQAEKSVQEQARTLRYEWFKKLMSEQKLDLMVTAHHMKDQAETVLFNMVRGSGIAGVSGMDALNGSLFRPFLDVEAQFIEDYQKENGVPFRLDQSNLSVKYSRNRLRNNVLPELEVVNVSAVKHIYEASQHIRQAELALKHMAKSLWDSNSKRLKYGIELSLTGWIDFEFSESLLFYMCRELGIEATPSKEVLRLLDSASGRSIGAGKYKVWKNRERLIFEFLEDEKIDQEFYMEILVVGEYDFMEGSLKICTVKNLSVPKLASNELIMPVEKLTWPLIIRTWRKGDKIKPFGLNGTQKVSDILIQNKVPLAEKSQVKVLESGGDILWVIGLKTSELTRVKEESGYYLKALIND